MILLLTDEVLYKHTWYMYIYALKDSFLMKLQNQYVRISSKKDGLKFS